MEFPSSFIPITTTRPPVNTLIFDAPSRHVVLYCAPILVYCEQRHEERNDIKTSGTNAISCRDAELPWRFGLGIWQNSISEEHSHLKIPAAVIIMCWITTTTPHRLHFYTKGLLSCRYKKCGCYNLQGFSTCGPRKNFWRATAWCYWNWVRFTSWTFKSVVFNIFIRRPIRATQHNPKTLI